jgi:lipoprotein-anchoring transpeptidase ErfK/SrfK
VLAQINNLSNPSLLYSGQTLTIPASGALTQTTPQADNSVPAANKHIIVDVSDQRAYIYENGDLKWTFVISTGIPGRETWRGEFKIQNKLPNAYASTWDLQMPYWLGFYWAGPLQNGFHALPILSNGVRLWEGLLGAPASYGCVILSVEDAPLLYDWADIGTPVTVRD